MKKKKRKRGNTASKAMKFLRRKGYTVAKVEKWNPFAHVLQDLFGFIDIVAIRGDKPGVLAVQTTHKNFFEGHKEKLEKKEKQILQIVKTWLKSGNRIWLFGWGKFWHPKGYDRKVIAPIINAVRLEDDELKFVKIKVKEKTRERKKRRR